MKTLRIGAVILLAAAFTGGAWAVPMDYGFVLDFTSGPLKGQNIHGVIAINGNDCPTGRCIGEFDPTNGLLGLNITVGGVPFAENNDTGFGPGQPFPDVSFDSLGRLIVIDYQGQTTFGGNPFTLDMTSVNVGVDLAAFYEGVVGSPTSLVSLAVVNVPEPGTLPLLGLALIGIGLAWRRSASKGATPKAELTMDAFAA